MVRLISIIVVTFFLFSCKKVEKQNQLNLISVFDVENIIIERGYAPFRYFDTRILKKNNSIYVLMNSSYLFEINLKQDSIIDYHLKENTILPDTFVNTQKVSAVPNKFEDSKYTIDVFGYIDNQSDIEFTGTLTNSYRNQKDGYTFKTSDFVLYSVDTVEKTFTPKRIQYIFNDPIFKDPFTRFYKKNINYIFPIYMNQYTDTVFCCESNNHKKFYSNKVIKSEEDPKTQTTYSFYSPDCFSNGYTITNNNELYLFMNKTGLKVKDILSIDKDIITVLTYNISDVKDIFSIVNFNWQTKTIETRVQLNDVNGLISVCKAKDHLYVLKRKSENELYKLYVYEY